MLKQLGNKITIFLVGTLGLNLQGAEVLTIVGRKSGQPRSLVVNPLEIDGERYLLSARGESNWVRNARAASEITLHRGRNRSEWLVTEVSDRDLKVHIMQAYLQRWGWQVQSFMKLGKGSSLAEIEARIDEFPIMAIQEKS